MPRACLEKPLLKVGWSLERQFIEKISKPWKRSNASKSVRVTSSFYTPADGNDALLWVRGRTLQVSRDIMRMLPISSKNAGFHSSDRTDRMMFLRRGCHNRLGWDFINWRSLRWV